MDEIIDRGRRYVLRGGVAMAAVGLTGGRAAADWAPSLRYPDPAIAILEPAFAPYRIFNSSVERLATGFDWMEGPVWFGDGRYLLVSDIPNDRMIRWDEVTGTASEFRRPSGWSNGNIRDLEGRLVTCEGGMRRVTRTEHDGSVTVLADTYEGKRLNSPNDLAVDGEGAIWFTDPPFQISNFYEGEKAEPEIDFHGVYRISPEGTLELVLDDLKGPNGIVFSPDRQVIYIVEGRAAPDRLVWAYDVGADGTLANKRRHVVATEHGALDGMACDVDGNLWCGWGSTGAPEADPEVLDGVRIFDPSGRAIGHIHLPERCANLCFGGRHGNRLFMAASHSLYAVYVNTQGANLP
ncbi:SMP-30/gluconolactonase/LRE family protein [uncultured Jannaschia sp.]|uniref:SMP-30/gluconolactonase/LRE family protein n=1 Tax=uncultured Jannaschia sp. TaxID=293347 RepID=UPI00262E5C66|nr:SMP-30/gluconolactonase/LRE family protein [uncultured Jannaschia sp.]